MLPLLQVIPWCLHRNAGTKTTRISICTHTQRSEPCRDGGVGWEVGADLASAGV